MDYVRLDMTFGSLNCPSYLAIIFVIHICGEHKAARTKHEKLANSNMIKTCLI